MKTLFGRKVAVDASMSIYQFLIAVRQKDGEMLTNDAGETTRYVYILTSPLHSSFFHTHVNRHAIHTRCSFALAYFDSHLMGFFYRTIRMVEQGIKPMYVFDGKPPDLKAGVVSLVVPVFFNIFDTAFPL